jgi:ABC-type proline/glycine betaine transport system substrate-binding protein
VAFLDNFVTETAQHNDVLAYMEDNDASTAEAAMYFSGNIRELVDTVGSLRHAAKVKAAL